MKPFQCLAILAFAFSMNSSLLGAVATTHGSEKIGKIEFQERRVQFGNISRGEEVQQRFHFKNIGKGPVKILGVHAACGCTAVEAARGKIYGINEEGYIDVTFDSMSFVGQVNKTISVVTNESTQSTRTLTLSANVIEEFSVDPPMIDFGDVVKNQVSTKTLRINSLRNNQFEISDVEYNRDILNVALTGEHGQFELKVSAKENIQAGFLRETIVLVNNSKAAGRFPIPVRGFFQGSIDVSPPYLEFGAIEKSSGAIRKLNLKGDSGLQIKTISAEININGLQLADTTSFLNTQIIGEGEKNQSVSVELLNLTEKEGSVHGKLFVETGDPAQSEIVVHFYGYFR